MSTPRIDRRRALAFGGAALVAPALAPAATIVPATPAAGIMLFDPGSAESRRIARAAHGQRLIALTGDPVRLWREQLAAASGPIGGVTRWSDYLILAGLAAEQGLRVRDERMIAVPGQAMLVHWTAR